MGITWEEYKKGGYGKANLTKEKIDHIRSRVLHNGKVYQGSEGAMLLKKKMEQKAYYERNR